MSTSTLKRWGEEGIIPDYRGRWTHAAAAHARIVARLREHGHSLDDIKEAGEDGRLAFGYVEELFPRARAAASTSRSVAKETGLEPALIERLWRGGGLPRVDARQPRRGRTWKHCATWRRCWTPDFRWSPSSRSLHVYGQSLRQIADAEARLFRIYVHEPLIEGGVPGTADGRGDGRADRRAAAADDAADGATCTGTFLRTRSSRTLIANMESDLATSGRETLGQLRVAIVFADLVGFVRFTEEEGEEEALDLVEQFRRVGRAVAARRRARVKNIGDGVMIVGHRSGGADRLGDRLPAGIRAALPPAHRHPLRPHRLPRRRLLRRATSTSPHAS